jgi:putative Ca2+/H+ antiporter (TMEM165/GDT1 family)
MVKSDKWRDVLAGGLLVILGLGAAQIGSTYHFGTLARIGPGFFPTALGFILAGLGFVVALSAPAVTLVTNDDHETTLGPDWRGFGCIVCGMLAFAATAEQLGLLIATFLCVFIASRGDRQTSLKSSFALAGCISIFGVILFGLVLRVQIPIIRGL